METKKSELGTYSKADCVTTVTEKDRDILIKDLPHKAVFIMTDVHDVVDDSPGFEERSDLLFVGNFNHNPNGDAAVYFVQKIFPLIKKEIQGIKLYIAGNNPTPQVRSLALDDIIVTGWVPDIKPFLEKCRVEVVPLRYGAGNKGKVGEAFSHGLPMVMTTIGAEGMNVIHGFHAFVADDPDKFADCAIELYKNKSTWEKFARNGECLVSAQYSSELMKKRIEYIMSFNNRKSLKSYRAIHYPLPPEFTIVILTDGNVEEIRKCLSSIRMNFEGSHEIILPIDCSIEESRKYLKSSHPEARIIEGESNALAERSNQGFVESLGNKVFLMKSCLGFREKCLEKLNDLVGSDPSDIFFPEDLTSKSEVESALCLLVTKQALQTLGGFDERFTSLKYQFIDFLLRARIAHLRASGINFSSIMSEIVDAQIHEDKKSGREREIFVEKWGCEPDNSLREINPAKSRNFKFPTSKDKFIENFERTSIHMSDEEYDRAEISIEKSLNNFHSSSRRGCSIEYQRLLVKAAEIARLHGKGDRVLFYLSEAYRIAPGDEKVILEYAKALVEIKTIQMANQIISKITDGLSAWAPKHGEESKNLKRGKKKLAITSIIILTLNEVEYTRKCVESIRSHTPEPHEIIFVDNGSKDGTIKWLKKLTQENPNFKLIENKINLGFAKGCNQGIAASSGEYILLLNNDVLVTEGWLSGMHECIDSAPDIGVVGPMTNNISGLQKVANADYGDPDHLEEYAKAFREKNRYRRIPARRIVGFCMLFRRELVEKIGLLDETFGSGNYEDDDFCLRAALEGYRNIIAGDVFIHHYGSRSFIGNRINYNSSLATNRKTFNEKWNGLETQSPLGKMALALKAMEKADELNQRGQNSEAVNMLVGGIKLFPGHKRLYYMLSEMLVDLKKHKDALDMLNEMPPDTNDTKKMALIGYCKEGMEIYDEAQEYGDRALSLNSAFPLALNLKGILSYKKGDKRAAENFFEKAIEADPGYGEPHTNFGVLKWGAEQKEEALNLLQKGFILSPTIADIVMAYYSAIAATGEFSRAGKVFQEAKGLYPLNRRIAFLLIDILIHQGKNKVAMENIEDAMIAFGVDDGILKAAIEMRNRIGIKEIDVKTKGKSTLSLCMIVKNEEQYLPKCLRSIEPAADEMIVVDTGSTDRTKEIAQAFGAKVYELEWPESFAEARNYSISKASGEWILVMDADEVLSSRDYDKLARVVKGGKSAASAYSFITRNYIDRPNVEGWRENDGSYMVEEAGIGWFPSQKVRLFPNDSRIKFENPVHEFVEPSLIRSGINISSGNVVIHHYGKLNEEKSLFKGETYYNLGKRKLDEMGRNVDALRELAIQAAELKKFDEAVELWKKIITLQPDNASAYLNLGHAYVEFGKYEDALLASKKAIELDPKMKEAVHNYSICELCSGHVEKAIAALEGLLRRVPGHPSAIGLLGVAYIIDGRTRMGLEYIEKLWKNKGEAAEYFFNHAARLFKAGMKEYVISLLEAAIESKNFNEAVIRLLEECKKDEDFRREDFQKENICHGGILTRKAVTHIAIISVNDRCSLGGRTLSSIIRKDGRHRASLIFFGEYDTRTYQATTSLRSRRQHQLWYGRADSDGTSGADAAGNHRLLISQHQRTDRSGLSPQD